MSRKEFGLGIALPVALGILPWILDKAGVTLRPSVINIGGCVAIIALCFGLFVLLSWLLRRSTRVAQRQLPLNDALSIAIVCAIGAAALMMWWFGGSLFFSNRNLKIVGPETFVNKEVTLDGHEYKNCQFVHVTFIFHGTAPFSMDSTNHIYGEIGLTVDDDSVPDMTMEMVRGLGAVKGDGAVRMLGPSKFGVNPVLHPDPVPPNIPGF